VPDPDLIVTKQVNPKSTVIGATVTFQLLVSNIGGTTTSAPIKVIDPMPTGLVLVSANGTGWDCAASTSTQAECVHPGPLAPGDPGLPITLKVQVTAQAGGSSLNVATVSTNGAENTSNNSGDALLFIQRSVPTPVMGGAGLATLAGICLWIARRRMRQVP